MHTTHARIYYLRYAYGMALYKYFSILHSTSTCTEVLKFIQCRLAVS